MKHCFCNVKRLSFVKHEVLACASKDVIIISAVLRPSAVAQGAVAGQVGSKTYPAFFEKGWGQGCEETDCIRREALRCNVKSLPSANMKRSLARVRM